MPINYQVRQDDLTADLICQIHYGRTAEVTELVLDANYGLANLGPVLPVGTEIILPDLARQAVKTVIRLWD
jgi:phage tail protein X